jgi:hypothetical protein
MSFGETGHADPETAAIRMRAGFVESANELNQIYCMLERVAGFIVGNIARTVSPERENISNPRLRVSMQNRFDLLFVVANASQVRDRIQFGSVLNALDKVVG